MSHAMSPLGFVAAGVGVGGAAPPAAASAARAGVAGPSSAAFGKIAAASIRPAPAGHGLRAAGGRFAIAAVAGALAATGRRARRHSSGAARAGAPCPAVAARVAVRRRASAAAPVPEGSGPQVVFVIGGPGSGKGTQCERIAQELGFVHLSAGDLLRQERAVEGSPLKKIIDQVILEGGTVPSEVIADLLEKAMRKEGWSSARFVIDGYPRSEAQLRGWEASLSSKVRLLFCLSLEVSREEMRRRLLGRSKTSGRADDNAETIEKRFVTFAEETGPLLAHFEASGKLRRLDGGRSPDKVWAEVRAAVEEAAEAAAQAA